ncbi:pentapeptide repeat-containing protein [Actinophytocola sp. KF-1]
MTRPEPLVDPATPRTVLPPVPRWRITAYVVTGLAGTVAAVTVLWWAGTRGLTGHDLVTARFDALRVGLSIAVGGGGVFALYLAWRRQRATEVDLDNRERALAHQLAVAADTKAHQERVAAATEQDAAARRVTDLYAKSVELLGAEQAPVRFGGLYALERLAQDNPEQRKTVVAVWCAYLRMPFVPDDDARREEREVRIAVQRLLARHLRPGDGFWPGMSVDLAGAALVAFDFEDVHVDVAQFHGATFVGPARFRRADFLGSAGFSRATFRDDARFRQATFHGTAPFRHTTFAGRADFTGATFAVRPDFEHATFRHDDGPPPS